MIDLYFYTHALVDYKWGEGGVRQTGAERQSEIEKQKGTWRQTLIQKDRERGTVSERQ